MADFIYDIETYSNCFTCRVVQAGTNWNWKFEISEYHDGAHAFRLFLQWLAEQRHRMVGFNNVGFDYPVIHAFITQQAVTYQELYALSQKIITTPYEDRFTNIIYQPAIEQVDLFLIHHFDNSARSTSLKALEFVMRMENIEDLPFHHSTRLSPEQIEMVHDYNFHDVKATHLFYQESEKALKFREEIGEKYGMDCTNFNDTKIGKQYFIKRLEDSGISCYKQQGGRRVPIQTPRPLIDLNTCIFPWIQFKNESLNQMVNYLRSQVIKETKGVFKGLSAKVGNFQFDFGTGGLHGSVDFREIHSDDEWVIIDLDVTSYYPSVAIVNKLFPEHMGSHFCTIYEDVKKERIGYEKGTAQNAALKLALNGVYGDSNSRYSPFYDPKYTMSVTLNGQLLLCLLSEWLMEIGAEMIQANTDGVTIYVRRSDVEKVQSVRKTWEMITGLELEEAVYSSMYIRDVNNYCAVYENGKLKQKGAYEYDKEWHKNHSALVVPKAVEAHLIHKTPIAQFIKGHDDIYDFMLFAKVPRNSRTELHDGDEVYPMSNNQRYYVSNEGGTLKKIMPPLAGRTDERVFNIESGWLVTPANDMKNAQWENINYNYYIEQAEKLVLELH